MLLLYLCQMFRLLFSKKFIFSALGITIITCSLVWYANKKIKNSAKDKCYDDVELIPYNRVGLLLGTSKITGRGSINQYFQHRIDATVALFKANKISFIIISGDNSVKDYDEPTDMRNELIKNGIDSTKIYLDYAGFRTFDSVVRCKEIFSQDSITIISQQFHNERAIYIADKLGIKAIGYNAKNVGKSYGFKTNVREYFARVKVILDFIIGTKPKFLGEKIEIK